MQLNEKLEILAASRRKKRRAKNKFKAMHKRNAVPKSKGGRKNAATRGGGAKGALLRKIQRDPDIQKLLDKHQNYDIIVVKKKVHAGEDVEAAQMAHNSRRDYEQDYKKLMQESKSKYPNNKYYVKDIISDVYGTAREAGLNHEKAKKVAYQAADATLRLKDPFKSTKGHLGLDTKIKDLSKQSARNFRPRPRTLFPELTKYDNVESSAEEEAFEAREAAKAELKQARRDLLDAKRAKDAKRIEQLKTKIAQLEHDSQTDADRKQHKIFDDWNKEQLRRKEVGGYD